MKKENELSWTLEEEDAFNAVEQQSNLGKQILRDMKKQEPVGLVPGSEKWMDVIVVNLVRSGINKHRARELAENFIDRISPAAYEQGRQAGMAQERALWELAKTSQEIEQPKPLTDEQIEELCWTEAALRLTTFARAIEAAHGIKEQS
jgi:hypothetical protein